MKNKVILFYKDSYSEIGSFTANWDELLVLTSDKAIIYRGGSGYEGENNHIVSSSASIHLDNRFKKECFEHLLSSYENKENVIDCDGYGGTNEELVQIMVVDKEEFDSRLLEGEIYFKNLYDITKKIRNEDYYLIKPFSYPLASIISNYMWPDFIKPFVYSLEEKARESWKNEEERLKQDKPFIAAYLGYYPQSELKDTDVIKALNEKYLTPLDKDNKWKDYGYKAKDYQGGYMFYIDVEHEGNKYRGVYIKDYRPHEAGENIARNHNSIQEYNGYKKEKVYWFIFEKIKWLMISKGYYDNSYVSLYVLDAEPMFNQNYQDEKESGEDTFYLSSSYLYPYLNSTFKEVAFDEEDRKAVNISLFSQKEYEEKLPLKKQRLPRYTDYALIKGYLPDSKYRGNDYPFVWSRTYIKGFNRMVSVSKDGSIIDFFSENHGFITYNYGGVQPSLSINGGKRVASNNIFTINLDELVGNREMTSEEEKKKEDIKTEEYIDSLMVDDDDDLPF